MDRSAKWQGPGPMPSYFVKAPDVGTAFQRNRDPSFAAQLDDLKKTEAQRRGEQEGSGSSMVRDDKPVPSLKPPPETRREQDRSCFNGAWAKEQMDWAMRHRDIGHQQALLQRGREQTRAHAPQQSR
ncbi:hypothetical protein FF098_015810 [Parvularcula flava]|uniref:Uncharacterized protein n=1 Tax=Aquisalinus luteolus TaxID=1566827 RepID=A0A8J3A5I1_9PROT|nr:hypothetical protein [Aquisalinus luteolus]NHK29382.1 hypothetical protein [Aquisalinus luteolus]GGI00945.1 hypothetical protein GCM10011355_30420 [Aquisalinus luteolus]